MMDEVEVNVFREKKKKIHDFSGIYANNLE